MSELRQSLSIFLAHAREKARSVFWTGPGWYSPTAEGWIPCGWSDDHADDIYFAHFPEWATKCSGLTARD